MNKAVIYIFLVQGMVLCWLASCERDVAPLLSGEHEAGNYENHEDSADYSWDSTKVVQIMLMGNSIEVSSTTAIVDGSKVTITAAGTYNISGSLLDGQIIVDAADMDTVRLVFNGLDIYSSTGAPVYILNALKTIVFLAENTENQVRDAETYQQSAEEPNAAVFSKSDLTIFGDGSLTVYGMYNDGIASKDGLIITSGNITVNAADDGIRGKDYLILNGGIVTVRAEGDGLKSDNDEDPGKGYILIRDGVINITSGMDAMQAATDLIINYAECSISAGGGSRSSIHADISAKCIKAAGSLTIDNGIYMLDAADDAIHSNASLVINGGTFSIATGDDGLHADSVLVVENGNINISESYEGIESAMITINNGDIRIVSSDDGLNGAGGRDGSGMGWPGRDNFAATGDFSLTINGGYIAIFATGDGIDVNGKIEMNGGDVIIHGPTSDMNSAVDYDASFRITGGFLVGAGSSRMAQAPGTGSTQCSIMLNFRSRISAGTLFHIQSSDGKEILTFESAKDFQSIAFSSPALIQGAAYNVFLGGSSTGTMTDGLYLDGTYTPGSAIASFTISLSTTKISIQ
jgi:hypothetical protein